MIIQLELVFDLISAILKLRVHPAILLALGPYLISVFLGLKPRIVFIINDYIAYVMSFFVCTYY